MTLHRGDSLPRLPHVEAFTKELEQAEGMFREISMTIAQNCDEFCRGYVAADRESSEAGRIWSEQRAEKIALLRLSGDDTPEDQIP